DLAATGGGGDRADVELGTPAHQPRHAGSVRVGHGHLGVAGGGAHGVLPQLPVERGWRGVEPLGLASGGSGIQADDGVEVDKPAGLVLGDLGGLYAGTRTD